MILIGPSVYTVTYKHIHHYPYSHTQHINRFARACVCVRHVLNKYTKLFCSGFVNRDKLRNGKLIIWNIANGFVVVIERWYVIVIFLQAILNGCAQLLYYLLSWLYILCVCVFDVSFQLQFLPAKLPLAASTVCMCFYLSITKTCDFVFDANSKCDFMIVYPSVLGDRFPDFSFEIRTCSEYVCLWAYACIYVSYLYICCTFNDLFILILLAVGYALVHTVNISDLAPQYCSVIAWNVYKINNCISNLHTFIARTSLNLCVRSTSCEMNRNSLKLIIHLQTLFSYNSFWYFTLTMKWTISYFNRLLIKRLLEM